MMTNRERIDALREKTVLDGADLAALLTTLTAADEEYLYAQARAVREHFYGKDVYLRGLIEFTNFCRNDCFYCGIRRSNAHAERYRLTDEDILACCDKGYALDFRTFVLQGGEDLYYSDEHIASLVAAIKQRHPDCAVTLSIGERPRASYERWFAAGADRYLLRQETANPAHYAKLHPPELSLENRKRCLADLKDIGYQVGCGIMVGSPYQTTENIVEDLFYMHDLAPQMVGIGPFIPHKDTPFRAEPAGTLADTLHLLGILRLMLPQVLLPATTALGTIDARGREKGLLAGANVIMPNLSPRGVRKKYMLYDGKICTGEEAAECARCLAGRVSSVGYRIAVSRGDCAGAAVRTGPAGRAQPCGDAQNAQAAACAAPTARPGDEREAQRTPAAAAQLHGNAQNAPVPAPAAAQPHGNAQSAPVPAPAAASEART